MLVLSTKAKLEMVYASPNMAFWNWAPILLVCRTFNSTKLIIAHVVGPHPLPCPIPWSGMVDGVPSIFDVDKKDFADVSCAFLTW